MQSVELMESAQWIERSPVDALNAVVAVVVVVVVVDAVVVVEEEEEPEGAGDGC